MAAKRYSFVFYIAIIVAIALLVLLELLFGPKW